MSDKDIPRVSGSIVEEEVVLSLVDLCRACSVPTEFVVELVEEGVLEPAGGELEEWSFSGASLKRVRKALRLHHDLGVNAAGVGLILDLLEEIEQLRARLAEADDSTSS